MDVSSGDIQDRMDAKRHCNAADEDRVVYPTGMLMLQCDLTAPYLGRGCSHFVLLLAFICQCK